MSSWQQLKRFTPARVALGRTGASLPTSALLEFGLAQAKARDAVYTKLDIDELIARLKPLGWGCVQVRSAARDRAEYLRRPDLGRCLDPEGAALTSSSEAIELLFVVADGLSARAAQTHAIPLLEAVKNRLGDWRVGPVVIAEQARVAIGDDIGERFRARIVVMLIGERPGLSAPDSLGAYITYNPRPGCHDAQRNCISNIRPEGLGYQMAAHRLVHLLESARRLRLTGIALKDDSPELPATLT